MRLFLLRKEKTGQKQKNNILSNQRMTFVVHYRHGNLWCITDVYEKKKRCAGIYLRKYTGATKENMGIRRDFVGRRKKTILSEIVKK